MASQMTNAGEFVIEKRETREGTVGKWFPIWHSLNGGDCADYLRQCVQTDHREGQEYRMRWVKS